VPSGRGSPSRAKTAANRYSALAQRGGRAPPERTPDPRRIGGISQFTLLEFKSPSDTLRAGDFQTFLAYALLYRAQNQPFLEPSKLHLLVLAPKLTKPYREELRTLGVTAQQQEPGIWRLQGGLVVHPTWVLETEELAGLKHPLLTLVSPKFLENRVATYDLLRQDG
jgi:hypothetical protein